jgi:hypothetical protein
MRTVVTFRSIAFNTTERKPYFINDGCFGDDLASWLIGELQRRGVTTDERPGQEDFGWHVDFQSSAAGSTLVLGFRPENDQSGGTWVGWVERSRGFLASVFGGRNRNVDPRAAELVHSILSSSSQISDIRWHDRRDFDKGLLDRGTGAP